MKTKARFESKIVRVPGFDCWLWGGADRPSGYGRVICDGKTHSAHRFSFALYKKPIDAGKYICHTCDVKSCVNPDHLFEGTPQDNMTDKVQKNRHSHGEKHRTALRNSEGFQKKKVLRGSESGKAKLSEAQVIEIRELLAKGVFQRDIAKTFGVSSAAISLINVGKNWAHV